MRNKSLTWGIFFSNILCLPGQSVSSMPLLLCLASVSTCQIACRVARKDFLYPIQNLYHGGSGSHLAPSAVHPARRPLLTEMGTS
jgi:hypothetical protein